MKTDMNKVNDIAKCLLHLEPEFKEYGIVSHPFFNSPIFPKENIDEGFYDLSNDTCGIKQGINSGMGNNVSLGTKKKESSGCC